MKKSILTLSLAALFTLVSNAQEPKKTTKKETPTTTGEDVKLEEPKKTDEPKKSGTRMAINEKGLPGNKSNTKKETPKETPKNQPGTTKE